MKDKKVFTRFPLLKNKNLISEHSLPDFRNGLLGFRNFCFNILCVSKGVTPLSNKMIHKNGFAILVWAVAVGPKGV